MCFKRKKQIVVTYIKDRKTLLLAAQEVDVLVVLDKGGAYKEKLLELKDELLYLSPRDNQEIFDMDIKIKDKIGDLKLIFNKVDGCEDEGVEKMLTNIFVMIKERDAKELK